LNAPSPILYEINTRLWLAELSERAGKPLTLAEVPDAEIESWRDLGFTHVWLMGVWQIGPQARRIALRHWEKEWRREFDSTEADVQGSPYAIQEYAVDARLGQPLDLLMFRERVNRAGIKLILDFVPNHFGLDASEPRRYPARFVQGESETPGTFAGETKLGPRWFAHGRDPHFPPWEDTVQVDYRVAEAQEAMALIAQTISMFGEGLRCDMAMLLLPEIFAETWRHFPTAGAHGTTANFWKRTIPKIRQLQPHVELIAEAYWDREQELQDAGFDFTYNKRVTDYLVRGQHAELRQLLQERPESFWQHSVHFLENHDEPRVASVLPLARHKAAAALILFLPGMALLHEGQLHGRTRFAHIQMSRRAPEPLHPEIFQFYTDLLHFLPQTRIRRGRPEIKVEGDLITIAWDRIDVGIANPGPTAATWPEAQGTLLYSTAPGMENRDGAWLVPPESAHIVRLATASPIEPEAAAARSSGG
jgi:hypothetical protein